MKVLVIGGGGREHALAWKAAQCQGVEQVFVAPGNAGTAIETGIENVAIAADDIAALLAFAQQQQVALTIVGPEAPLVAGVVDSFTAAGLTIFGPTQAAAQLEGSKAFSKDFLARHQIPTAAYGTFTDVEAAQAYVRAQGTPIVIKADGLAAGKGVIIAQTLAEADAAIADMLAGNRFGDAGSRVVIEEFLVGEEASFIVMVDGTTALPFASSQDHKARDNGDQGPNTGGMGAYSPAPVVTPSVHEWVMQHVIQPTIEGMAAEGHPYTGFLYAGLMIAADGSAKVLEYNCRFGDPETQPIMMRLQSDLVELCLAACAGQLAGREIQFDPRATVGVVMAAGGYPDGYAKGDAISGITEAEATGVKVFHAGTALNTEGQVVTAGGRVLCVTAIGDSVSAAQQQAYAGVSKIRWNQAFYRTDIGYRAIAREQA
ncbi:MULTISPECIES: phosphoribosylamine--glycine ligase [Pseudidiomarina]|uniref:Phosphoribosylamine--glycine ligase n=3 Tax=Pseudidiomarina TaxID=2800384 RepID=A0A368UXT3_9GAMM|nr:MULTISPECIES: phosphoribosylamine--glycine ligase [Pseudidiomarina]MDT7526752.1 phosphoribosylamine--glycine ligase [Pseudidiomarina sp. GXY010]PWW06887.1 phosphoribosylamine--glycine ligase [Pseudidiomarina maritima]RBP86693.1 phosphoribosylamine--glycine ligase [Pseudidiomarina tainanensis]RCW33642.1 phosphoribosylamine--glycine ligase [Pseudidiomarina tainanensis]